MINAKMIARIMGALFFIEAGFLILCSFLAVYYNESDISAFLYSAAITAGAGSIAALAGKNAEKRISRRDGYVIVTLAWVFFSLFGMLPFYLSGYIPTITDAFFETMSGFTTTGASILDNIESLPHGLLFWRSMTQWIGGLGIVFFTIAVLPIFGVGSVQLFAAEATGPTHDKVSAYWSYGQMDLDYLFGADHYRDYPAGCWRHELFRQCMSFSDYYRHRRIFNQTK
jgi:trk system potassium uptake protein TrkH